VAAGDDTAAQAVGSLCVSWDRPDWMVDAARVSNRCARGDAWLHAVCDEEDELMIKGRVVRALVFSKVYTGKHVRELRRGHWLDSTPSRDQETRPGALLEHAALHVPYCREFLAENGCVGDAWPRGQRRPVRCSKSRRRVPI
jgi:hypothetical protein